MIKQKELVPKKRFEGFLQDWKINNLKELASFSKGRGYSKKDLSSNGNPIILYGHLYTDYQSYIQIVEAYATKKENSVVSSGDEVIVPSSGETAKDIARASVVSKAGVILAGDLNIIKPNHLIDSLFLALSITNSSIQKELIKRVQGSSVVHLYNSDIEEVNLIYPSFKEQQKIGQFFKHLDNMIELEQRKIDKTKALKSAYLSEMFLAEGERVPKKRFAGFTDEWQTRKLKEIADKAVDNRGKTPPLSINGSHPLIEVASLGNSRPDYSKVEKFLDDYSFENNLRDYIQKNDILFSTVGRIGIVSLMDENETAAIAQNIVAFRARENYVPEYLYALFSTEQSKIKANRIVMGAVQPSIKVSQLINVEYYVTNNKKEQQMIGQFFKHLDQMINTHEQKLEKLKATKQAYLNEMFV